MSTTDKNFKVKNGLNVGGTATFDTDIILGSAPISFDTQTKRLKIQVDGTWSPVAFLGDVPDLANMLTFMDIGLSIDYNGQPTYIIQGNGINISGDSKFIDAQGPTPISPEYIFDSGVLV